MRGNSGAPRAATLGVGQQMMTERIRLLLAGFLITLWAVSAPAGSVVGRFVADQADQTTYVHYHADLLYTHDGDDRGRFGPEHDLARDNICAIFADLGLDVEYHGFWFGGSQYFNVVATLVGTAHPEQQYIVGAHYDSKNNPGADDDASGVAALLELARILARYESEYTIVFITFDLEELGKIGSTAYVDDHLSDDIQAMIALDMIAWDCGSFATRVHGNAIPLRDTLAAALDEYGDGLDAIPSYPVSNSDHAPFQDAGFAAVLVIEELFRQNPCYHQPCDSIDTPDYINYELALAHVRGVAGYLADAAHVHVDDCDENGIPDADEILAEPALDCNENGFLDLCEPGGDQDCNGNSQPDVCDIYFEISQDCNENDVPDECEVGGLEDCNNNGIPDLCDIYNGTSSDWNGNDIPDDCEPKRVYYIDDDAPGDPGPGDPSVSDPAEDGSSTHPFDAIQEAIPLAIPGDVI
ncbi:MAG: M28 family peptidase, partial [Planctomycetes bacterium]|nr:M28 family peptidase [Planctomycetota bacterium]